MQEWQEYAGQVFAEQSRHLWVWFDSLNREEWLLVLGVCCAVGFLMMKGWGKRGPC